LGVHSEAGCSAVVLDERDFAVSANGVHRATPWIPGDETERSADAGAREARIVALVAEEFDFVWRLLRRWGLERSAADDAAQEVFVLALRKLDSIDPGRERTFLYGTALRVAANARRSGRRQRAVVEQVWQACRDAPPLPDEVAEQVRTCSLLDGVLEKLPPALMRGLVLAEIEELEAKEIAALEAIPLGTVASRLRRARKLLRKELGRLRAQGQLGEPES
jgi:RNA polymerase sigma-70 factor (ECF subfamily)